MCVSQCGVFWTGAWWKCGLDSCECVCACMCPFVSDKWWKCVCVCIGLFFSLDLFTLQEFHLILFTNYFIPNPITNSIDIEWKKFPMRTSFITGYVVLEMINTSFTILVFVLVLAFISPSLHSFIKWRSWGGAFIIRFRWSPKQSC